MTFEERVRAFRERRGILERYAEILRAVIADDGGTEVSTEGDAFSRQMRSRDSYEVSSDDDFEGQPARGPRHTRPGGRAPLR